jgi:hypothetical protein
MTYIEKQSELKPCPFCGGKAIIRNGKSYWGQDGEKHQDVVIECHHQRPNLMPETNARLPECRVKPVAIGVNKERAIEAWNTRAPTRQTEPPT